MGQLTLKVDFDIHSDRRFLKLNHQARSIFWSILATAGVESGIEIEKLATLVRESVAVAIRHLVEAELVTVDGGVVYPTRRLARRHSDAARVSAYRSVKASKKLESHQPAPPQTPADSDDWGSPDPVEEPIVAPIASPAPSPEAEPKAKTRKKPKTAHEEGVREAMLADGVEPEFADAWLSQRMGVGHQKYKANPVTMLAWKGVKREAELAKWPLNEAVKRMAEKTWQGFDRKWVQGVPIPGSLEASAGSPAPNLPFVPEGYKKDGFGRLVKRSGGVAL